MQDALFTSNSDEWYTPSSLIESLKQEFDFTLDPCGCLESHITEKYYDKRSNGLLQSWENEIVFCNPPYSEIKSWCKKCAFEYLHHNTTVVLLIPSRTDTSYFHDYILPFAELRFIKGRLKFSNSKSSAPFPSLLAIYRGC